MISGSQNGIKNVKSRKKSGSKIDQKRSGRKTQKGQRSGNAAGIGGMRGPLGRLLKGLEGVGLADLEGRSGFHKIYTEL